MKNSKYYVCPICGNLTVCTGNAEISCCGKKLEALEPKKADDCLLYTSPSPRDRG